MRASLFDDPQNERAGDRADAETASLPEGVQVEGSGVNEGIFDKAVLLSVEIGRFGVKRGASIGAVEVQADKRLLRLTKEILASPELKKVQKFDGEVRRYVAMFALPSQFRSGVYLIPLGLVGELDEYLSGREAARVELVDAFLAVYDVRCEEARVRLGELGSYGDYPNESAVAKKFYLSHRWIEASVPGRLSSVSRALWLREEEKARASWESATKLGVEVLRAEFQGLVDHMVERLTPDESGKPKIYKKSLVENLDRFMGELFEAKNSVLDDNELAALVQRGRELLQGVESKDLKSQALAESIKAGFVDIKGKLDGLVGARPGRKVDLSEGEDW